MGERQRERQRERVTEIETDIQAENAMLMSPAAVCKNRVVTFGTNIANYHPPQITYS